MAEHTFSSTSEARLSSCDERLQKIARAVLGVVDCAVIQGHRSDEDQDIAFFTGRSKLRAGQSLHNQVPSLAIDIVPYYGDETPRIPWDIDKLENRLRFTLFAGIVLGVARKEKGVFETVRETLTRDYYEAQERQELDWVTHSTELKELLGASEAQALAEKLATLVARKQAARGPMSAEVKLW